MPADEVTHGTDVESRARTGPRHAAPKKPLFTRFHMPAGKAIALAAMPTAVLMGMGFTPTLANAEDQPASKSLTADEYKDCVAALEDGASASASPSASAGESEDEAEATPSASATSDPDPGSDSGSGGGSSSDSGSDDETEPTPSASAGSPSGEPQSGSTPTPSPSASESGGNVLEEIGDAITGIFTGGESETPSASASPTPSASASESASEDGKTDDAADAVKDTTDKVTDTVKDTVKDTTDAASKAAEDTTDAVKEAAEEATASPSPSASSSTDPDDCPVATDAVGGVDNPVPLPDEPWYLNASSLLLKGADYKGIVKVRTANGTTKEVLKYVISDGTDIGDLHQTVEDEQSGKTYHVQAAKGSTSTIRDGDTVMYTESISGNLLGLIPVTFSPKSPPPLNIPLIYFTKVKVVQAGQFGGTLHVPGLHSYQTD
ncbi:hypothetical protein [Streptomyces sp. S.PB5]|uniref:hypothetical protein n=1 Tax=Streptomyces sp. S.PB5 TaxID=3020844 RepID=UPI0025B224EA|nr:hypothetical protein [Streptomyces sp. S.PB5]MDN3024928.1 hypothetical protein [Streptomyces sp. S.PB5]